MSSLVVETGPVSWAWPYLQGTYRIKVQEKSPVFFYILYLKKLFWFLNVLYSIWDCICNYNKVLWNE